MSSDLNSAESAAAGAAASAAAGAAVRAAVRAVASPERWIGRRSCWLVVAVMGAAALTVAGASGASSAIAVTPTTATPSAVSRLTPKPVAAQALGSAPFLVTAKTKIVAAGDAGPVGNYLAGLLRRSTGYDLAVSDRRPHPGDIVLKLGPGYAPAGHQQEGYTLVTNPDNATVAADQPEGLFDGVQTLRQLFPQWVESNSVVEVPWTVQSVAVSDYPRFSYRGAMLDVARSFQTVSEVKKYIDGLAQFKINTLHLHLADDQAWRIVINTPASNPSDLNYQNLIDIGSHGAASVASANDPTPLGTEPGHQGYYTQQQYKSIVAYAKSRFITIVPEIDGPGHTNAALASIPQLNPDGKAKPMNDTGDVGYSTLDANSPITYEFLNTVFSQLAAMTPGPYIHVGGDEAAVTGHANYLSYVSKVVPLVNGLGKATMGWNEYADVNLPPGSVIQYWDGDLAPVLNQVARGAKVVMSPAAQSYLDQKYNAESRIGLHWACQNNCDYDTYYNWNPVQGGLKESDVLGVEAPLWSETVRGIDQADWLTYPRLIATAEIGWTPQAKRDVTNFAMRLAAIGARLTVQATNFYASPGVKWTVDTEAPDVTIAKRTTPLSGVIARFTAPGADPSTATARINYGDGTVPVDAVVRQPKPATDLSSNGVFSVASRPHWFPLAGSYRVRITITTSSGTQVSPFSVTVQR
ncbi:MAG TPA: family 20 glycosylhydrolase [Jatrophihabitans sp.]|jgi:hexosaminidase